MSPINRVLDKFDRTRTRLATKMVTPKRGEGGAPLLIIEGNERSFRFLSELLAAIADGQDGCDFQLDPHGAGSYWFIKESTHGLYFHRLPCMDKRGFRFVKRRLRAKKTPGRRRSN